MSEYGIDHKAKQCGAVIVFEREITQEAAQKILSEVWEIMKLEEKPTVHVFNPTMGTPVFYVP